MTVRERIPEKVPIELGWWPPSVMESRKALSELRPLPRSTGRQSKASVDVGRLP